MGKIRISSLGTEDEQARKQKARIKRVQKAKRLTHIAGMKGGEKIVDMSATAPEVPPSPVEPVSPESPKAVKSPKKARTRSHAYLAAKKMVDHSKLYKISEAIELVKKTSFSKFDGSVEAHINCTEKGLRGQVNLPHGTGRQVRVAIASDELIEKINKHSFSSNKQSFSSNSGKIDFDILVASPAMMPKLAKIAKVLGPKGLMPNPKAGTISDKPEELVKKLSSGQTQFKSETEAPIIHFVLGKVSFTNKDLEENYQALMTAIGLEKIISIFLKSTMSPSVKIRV